MRTIKFTGTDGKELETAEHKLEGIEKNKNEFTYIAPYQLGPTNIEINAADGGTQQFINTNFTSATFGMELWNGMNEFNIITSCDWLTPNDSFISYNFLAAQDIKIGRAHKPAIFNIKLNSDLALLSNTPLAEYQLKQEIMDVQRGAIHFLDKTSTLQIENAHEKEYKVFLKAPLDPGKNDNGIVYLKGKLKILDKSLGTQEHKLATLGWDEYNRAEFQADHFQAFFTHAHNIVEHHEASIVGAEHSNISDVA